jgi:hypothetical protein
MQFKNDEPYEKRQDRIRRLSKTICQYYNGKYKLEGFYEEIAVDPPQPYNLSLLSRDLNELYKPNFEYISIGLDIIDTKLSEIIDSQLPEEKLEELGAYHMSYHLMGGIRPQNPGTFIWMPQDKSFTANIRFTEEDFDIERLVKGLSELVEHLRENS